LGCDVRRICPSETSVRFEVFTAVTVKNVAILSVTACDSCINRRFEETYRLHYQGKNNGRVNNNFSSNIIFPRSVLRLLITANILPSSQLLATLLMEAIFSTKTSVLTREARRNIPQDDILHSNRSENLKSYIALTGWTV
jgi:hypothetical protein